MDITASDTLEDITLKAPLFGDVPALYTHKMRDVHEKLWRVEQQLHGLSRAVK